MLAGEEAKSKKCLSHIRVAHALDLQKNAAHYLSIFLKYLNIDLKQRCGKQR